MKLFVVLMVLAGLYLFGLLKTTDLMLSDVQHINATYQYVANNSQNIANGQPIPGSLLAQP